MPSDTHESFGGLENVKRLPRFDANARVPYNVHLYILQTDTGGTAVSFTTPFYLHCKYISLFFFFSSGGCF